MTHTIRVVPTEHKIIHETGLGFVTACHFANLCFMQAAALQALLIAYGEKQQTEENVLTEALRLVIAAPPYALAHQCWETLKCDETAGLQPLTNRYYEEVLRRILAALDSAADSNPMLNIYLHKLQAMHPEDYAGLRQQHSV